MANNIYSRVTIKSSKVDEIIEKYFTNNVLDCEKVIPLPSVYPKAYHPIFPDWYVWRRQNWGSKWNVYDANGFEKTDDTIVLNFYTANRAITPIMQKLYDLYNGDISIKYEFADEDFGNNCGIWEDTIIYDKEGDYKWVFDTFNLADDGFILTDEGIVFDK